ncbi:hypothetical protein HK405_002848 [Cladochytrium tenue]|nr:hypothetical protein HK405_002848 [Cladochytrium tenue]
MPQDQHHQSPPPPSRGDSSGVAALPRNPTTVPSAPTPHRSSLRQTTARTSLDVTAVGRRASFLLHRDDESDDEDDNGRDAQGLQPRCASVDSDTVGYQPPPSFVLAGLPRDQPAAGSDYGGNSEYAAAASTATGGVRATVYESERDLTPTDRGRSGGGSGSARPMERRSSAYSTHSTKLRKLWHWLVYRFMNSVPVQFVLWAVFEPWIQVSAAALAFALTSGALVLFLLLLFGAELPGIGFYNLTHLIIALLGKALISAGILLSVLCAKAVVANSMVFSSQGASLTEVAVKYGWHSPQRGKVMRCLFWLSLAAVEATLWILEYQMEWNTLTVSNIGTYDCTPVTFPNPIAPQAGAFNYLAGNVEYGSIYSYGLPLVDGLLGGWGSYPLSGPLDDFIVEGPGLAYLVTTHCSEPSPVSGPQSSFNRTAGPLATLELMRAEFWENLGIIQIDLTFSAFSHDAANLTDRDVRQECLVELMSGPATTKFDFVVDEWLVLSGGGIAEIILGDPYKSLRSSTDPDVLDALPSFASDKLVVTHSRGTDSSSGLYTAEVRERLMPVASVYANVTSWIIEQIQYTLGPQGEVAATGGTLTCTPVRSTGLCAPISWGVSQRRFAVEHTARAVSALVGQLSHVVVGSFAGGLSTCILYGDTGRGAVDAPAWTKAVVLTALGVTALLALWQVGSFWLIGGGSSPLAAAAGEVLDDAVLLLWYIRRGVGHVVPSRMPAGSPGDGRSLRRFLSGIQVRFGELRESRGDSSAVLALDTPGAIIKARVEPIQQ